MPRWLIASFFAFLLSCYGFATFAQVAASEPHDGIGKLTTSAQDASSAADPLTPDADDEAAGLDEANLDFTECLTGEHPLLVAAVTSAWPPRSASTSSPSPWLERPKRPPRGIALPV
jgi:hypothetical protein